MGAGGTCCSGVVDSYGACNGNDASGVQQVTLAVALPAGMTQAMMNDVNSPQRQQFDAELRALLARVLGRSEDKIVVTNVRLTRRLGVVAGGGGRALTVGASADSSLLPYGGDNNVPEVRVHVCEDVCVRTSAVIAACTTRCLAGVPADLV